MLRRTTNDDENGEKNNNFVKKRRSMSLRRTNDYRDLKKLLSSTEISGGENAGELVISVDIRERFYQLCSSFLGGAWKLCTPEQMRITHIKGGMTNMLFLCQLPEDAELSDSDTDKTLLRIYFNPETENRLVAESVIFTLLSERHLGPKLYGVFNEGRLEEFIVSNTLCTKDIWDEEMSRMIAEKMARMHQMNLPISKDPTYLFEAIERWIEQLERLCPDATVEIRNDSNLQRFLNLQDLRREYHVVKKALSKSQSSVAFCHNDLQEGNILQPLDASSNSKDLVVIDFEYASYNFRAFDIANHFTEWSIDYSTKTAPFFTISLNKFPDLDQQKNFVRSYLSCLNESVDEKSMDRFLDEIRPFYPVPHFFWGIWSLVQKELSPVTFGFEEYARQRLNIYFNQREQLLTLLK